MRNASPPRMLVGGDAVAEWLQRRSLAVAKLEKPSPFHVNRDVDLLVKLARGAIPLNALGLETSERDVAIERLIDSFIHGSRREFNITANYQAIEYLAGVETLEDRQRLCDHICELLVSDLPVTPDDMEDDESQTLAIALTLADIMPEIPGVPTDDKIRESAKKAGLLAYLYGKRAEMMAAADEVFEPPVAADWEVTRRWPDGHILHVFAEPQPTAEQVWDDVLHLNYLAAEQVSVDDLRRNDIRMTKAVRQLLKHLVEHTEVAQMPRVFNALEYIFDIHGPEQGGQRDELHRLLRNRLALSMPLRAHDRSYMANALYLAEGYATRLSRQPVEVVSELYARRAQREVVRDMSRPDADDFGAHSYGGFGQVPENLDHNLI